ncbi:MAG: hypothetical protein K0Q96_1234 [Rubrobacteraceae bacterium]|nr:hypothetical protein [Rubrobacteraceae bacterium]
MGLIRHRTDIQGDVGARGDDVYLGLTGAWAHQNCWREARIAEERVLAVALDLFPFELLDRDDEPRGPRNRVDAALRHCPVRHRSAQGNFHPERALLRDAELVLLGLADNGGVHSYCVASLDERLDSGHHPLFIHRMTEYQPASERGTGVPNSTHGNYGRRQISLGVACPAPVDTLSIFLCTERRMIPVLRVSFRHHVRVRLEEQGLPLTISLPHGPHVRTARRDLLGFHLETRALQVVCDEPGYARLVSVKLFGTVDARDADEFSCQVHEFLAVDPIQYIFEHSLELDVHVHFGA